MHATTILSLLFATSALALPNVHNYASQDCGARRMSGCNQLPQHTCCHFGNTWFLGVAIQSATNSIKWEHLQTCDVGTWFYPRLESPGVRRWSCGTERMSAVGSSSGTEQCYGANGNAHMNDGAMWYNIPTTLPKENRCRVGLEAGTRQAVPDQAFNVAQDYDEDMSYGIEIQLPVPWGAGPSSGKRSLAGRIETPACTSIQYASTYVWGDDDDSVYIVPGTKEMHEKLAEYHQAPQPKQKYADFVKGLGATYYENWRDAEELRSDYESEQARKREVEKREDLKGVDAEPAPKGAGDTPHKMGRTFT